MDSLFFHPKTVHIPIALAVLMPLIATAIAIAWWRSWLPSRAWFLVVLLQAALVGSAAVALGTGEAEEDRVERVVPESVIEAHEEAAEMFVWASEATLALMLLALALHRRKTGLPAAAIASLASLLVLGLGYRTGEAGGHLVYRHGAASAYGRSAARAPATNIAAPSRAGDALREHEHEHDDD